jgi:hypothetical protein
MFDRSGSLSTAGWQRYHSALADIDSAAKTVLAALPKFLVNRTGT